MAEIKNGKPSKVNLEKFNTARNDLNDTYEKEHANQQSSQAQKAVNEISGLKSTNKAKLRASSEEERLKLWK